MKIECTDRIPKGCDIQSKFFKTGDHIGLQSRIKQQNSSEEDLRDYPEPFLQHFDPALEDNYDYDFDSIIHNNRKLPIKNQVKRHLIDGENTGRSLDTLAAFATLVQSDLPMTASDRVDRIIYLSKKEEEEDLKRSFAQLPSNKKENPGGFLSYFSNKGNLHSKHQNLIPLPQKPSHYEYDLPNDDYLNAEDYIYIDTSSNDSPSYFDGLIFPETTPDSFKPSTELTDSSQEFQPVTHSSRRNSFENSQYKRPSRNADHDPHGSIATSFQNFNPPSSNFHLLPPPPPPRFPFSQIRTVRRPISNQIRFPSNSLTPPQLPITSFTPGNFVFNRPSSQPIHPSHPISSNLPIHPPVSSSFFNNLPPQTFVSSTLPPIPLPLQTTPSFITNSNNFLQSQKVQPHFLDSHIPKPPSFPLPPSHHNVRASSHFINGKRPDFAFSKNVQGSLFGSPPKPKQPSVDNIPLPPQTTSFPITTESARTNFANPLTTPFDSHSFVSVTTPTAPFSHDIIHSVGFDVQKEPNLNLHNQGVHSHAIDNIGIDKPLSSKRRPESQILRQQFGISPETHSPLSPISFQVNHVTQSTLDPNAHLTTGNAFNINPTTPGSLISQTPVPISSFNLNPNLPQQNVPISEQNFVPKPGNRRRRPTTRPVTSRPFTTRPVTSRPFTTRPVTSRPFTTRPVTTRTFTKPQSLSNFDGQFGQTTRTRGGSNSKVSNEVDVEDDLINQIDDTGKRDHTLSSKKSGLQDEENIVPTKAPVTRKPLNKLFQRGNRRRLPGSLGLRRKTTSRPDPETKEENDITTPTSKTTTFRTPRPSTIRSTSRPTATTSTRNSPITRSPDRVNLFKNRLRDRLRTRKPNTRFTTKKPEIANDEKEEPIDKTAIDSDKRIAPTRRTSQSDRLKLLRNRLTSRTRSKLLKSRTNPLKISDEAKNTTESNSDNEPKDLDAESDVIKEVKNNDSDLNEDEKTSDLITANQEIVEVQSDIAKSERNFTRPFVKAGKRRRTLDPEVRAKFREYLKKIRNEKGGRLGAKTRKLVQNDGEVEATEEVPSIVPRPKSTEPPFETSTLSFKDRLKIFNERREEATKRLRAKDKMREMNDAPADEPDERKDEIIKKEAEPEKEKDVKQEKYEIQQKDEKYKKNEQEKTHEKREKSLSTEESAINKVTAKPLSSSFNTRDQSPKISEKFTPSNKIKESRPSTKYVVKTVSKEPEIITASSISNNDNNVITLTVTTSLHDNNNKSDSPKNTIKNKVKMVKVEPPPKVDEINDFSDAEIIHGTKMPSSTTESKPKSEVSTTTIPKTSTPKQKELDDFPPIITALDQHSFKRPEKSNTHKKHTGPYKRPSRPTFNFNISPSKNYRKKTDSLAESTVNKELEDKKPPDFATPIPYLPITMSTDAPRLPLEMLLPLFSER